MTDKPRTGRDFARGDARTRSHFDALALAHGGDVRAVDWGSRASQEARFSVLATIGDLRGCKLLDVGCGQGDLLAWLELQGIDCDYRGIDLSPEMIALARRRFPKRSFEVANLLEQEPPFERCDYVLASGIFYLRREAPEEYLRSMIECMFAHCTRGVAFNSLSAWGEELAFDDEFRADPYLTLVTASSITERLALRHDYHPRDFTIFMHRAGAK